MSEASTCTQGTKRRIHKPNTGYTYHKSGCRLCKYKSVLKNNTELAEILTAYKYDTEN